MAIEVEGAKVDLMRWVARLHSVHRWDELRKLVAS